MNEDQENLAYEHCHLECFTEMLTKQDYMATFTEYLADTYTIEEMLGNVGCLA